MKITKRSLFIVVLASVLLTGCGGAQEQEQVVPEDLTWVTIEEMTGTGALTTEPFSVDYKPWGIGWAHIPIDIENPGGASFKLTVYDTADPSVPVKVLADSHKAEASAGYIYRTGTFYIVIEAAETNWTINISRYE